MKRNQERRLDIIMARLAGFLSPFCNNSRTSPLNTTGQRKFTSQSNPRFRVGFFVRDRRLKKRAQTRAKRVGGTNELRQGETPGKGEEDAAPGCGSV